MNVRLLGRLHRARNAIAALRSLVATYIRVRIKPARIIEFCVRECVEGGSKEVVVKLRSLFGIGSKAWPTIATAERNERKEVCERGADLGVAPSLYKNGWMDGKRERRERGAADAVAAGDGETGGERTKRRHSFRAGWFTDSYKIVRATILKVSLTQIYDRNSTTIINILGCSVYN